MSYDLTPERLEEIEAALRSGMAHGPGAVHAHECRAWRHGRTTHGPCTCGAEAVEACIADVMLDLVRMARRALELERRYAMEIHRDEQHKRLGTP